MKRKVEYIVHHSVSRLKSESMKQLIARVKAENRYHFATTFYGTVLNLKDAEVNNTEDSLSHKAECIHILFIMPSTLLELMIFTFISFNLRKKLVELGKRFANAKVIDIKTLQTKTDVKAEFRFKEINYN